MKTLVTGRNGFIVRHLIPRLAADNHQVQTTDRTTNALELLQDFEPDIIFHLGAELKNEEIMFEINVSLTMTLMEWCRQQQKKNRHTNTTKLVLFGSSSEYGRSNKPQAESDCPLPDTIYEGTKAATAMLARAWADNSIGSRDMDDEDSCFAPSLASSSLWSNISPAPVSFEEIIDLSINFMRRIPPRKLISLARTFARDQGIKLPLEEAPTISLFQQPPLWATVNSAPSLQSIKVHSSVSNSAAVRIKKKRKMREDINKSVTKTKY